MTNYPLEIRQQRRKSLAMRVTPDGLLVLIPAELTPDAPEVREFVSTGLAKIAGVMHVTPEEPLTMDELHVLVNKWAERIGVTVKRVQVRSMHHKWASCSSVGTLTVNRAIYHLPRRLIDYIICHDLVHLRIPDHGRGFKALMNGYLPDWRERELELSLFSLLREVP